MRFDTLMRASLSALESSPAFHGLRVAGSRTSHRGSAVELTDHAVTISVTADWLESDLTVQVRLVGGGTVDLAALVDAADVRGLSLTRLPRDISSESLGRRLAQLLGLLEQAGVLAGAEGAQPPG